MIPKKWEKIIIKWRKSNIGGGSKLAGKKGQFSMGIFKAHPLKQGLKLFPGFFGFQTSRIREAHPLKQGLKQIQNITKYYIHHHSRGTSIKTRIETIQ